MLGVRQLGSAVLTPSRPRVVGYRMGMPRTFRTSLPAPLLLLVSLIVLTACSGSVYEDGSSSSDDSSATASASPSTEATASTASKSCQGIIGSGAVEDIAKIFDKYKNNNNPFTRADAKKMHDALDRLAKAGDNASPKIREDVVQLVADAGSLIDSRAHLEGVGKVASVETVQKEIDTLCR
jgi:hypothetical protein